MHTLVNNLITVIRLKTKLGNQTTHEVIANNLFDKYFTIHSFSL